MLQDYFIQFAGLCQYLGLEPMNVLFSLAGVGTIASAWRATKVAWWIGRRLTALTCREMLAAYRRMRPPTPLSPVCQAILGRIEDRQAKWVMPRFSRDPANAQGRNVVVPPVPECRIGHMTYIAPGVVVGFTGSGMVGFTVTSHEKPSDKQTVNYLTVGNDKDALPLLSDKELKLIGNAVRAGIARIEAYNRDHDCADVLDALTPTRGATFEETLSDGSKIRFEDGRLKSHNAAG